MSQTIEALFDGNVLHPREQLQVPPNTLVQITVKTAPAKPAAPYSSLDVAESLNLEGPPDWSEKLDEYLYGDRNPPG